MYIVLASILAGNNICRLSVTLVLRTFEQMISLLDCGSFLKVLGFAGK